MTATKDKDFKIDIEDFGKAIEIISGAFDYCSDCELGHREVHTAFLFLILSSIYESIDNVEVASEFINTVIKLAEGSYKMNKNVDVSDDVRDTVVKFLGIHINRFDETIH